MNCGSWVAQVSALAATSEVAAMFETNTGCKIAVSTCLNHRGDFSTTTFPFGSLVQITVSILYGYKLGVYTSKTRTSIPSHPLNINTPQKPWYTGIVYGVFFHVFFPLGAMGLTTTWWPTNLPFPGSLRHPDFHPHIFVVIPRFGTLGWANEHALYVHDHREEFP